MQWVSSSNNPPGKQFKAKTVTQLPSINQGYRIQFVTYLVEGMPDQFDDSPHD
jgi:hypothetical protein